jgi:tRNA(adenine34) deaminase
MSELEQTLQKALLEALQEALKAQALDEVPVGAIVLKDGKIIGRGHNRRETDQDPIAHAEILAIQDAARALGSWRLIDCTLIVTLEPCPMCLSACQQARVSEVVYGAADPKGGALSLGFQSHSDPRLNHRFPVQHTPDPACGQILSDFFRNKRKTTPNTP